MYDIIYILYNKIYEKYLLLEQYVIVSLATPIATIWKFVTFYDLFLVLFSQLYVLMIKKSSEKQKLTRRKIRGIREGK